MSTVAPSAIAPTTAQKRSTNASFNGRFWRRANRSPTTPATTRTVNRTHAPAPNARGRKWCGKRSRA